MQPQDLAIWAPDLEQGVHSIFGRGGETPTEVFHGPKFSEPFLVLPEEIKFLFGLNIGNDTDKGFENLFAQTEAVWDALEDRLYTLEDRLYALEVGNEPERTCSAMMAPTRINGMTNFIADLPALGLRPEGYSIEDYITEWLNFTDIRSDALDIPKPFVQAGTFQAPEPSNPFNVSRALDLGVDKTGHVKTLAGYQVSSPWPS